MNNLKKVKNIINPLIITFLFSFISAINAERPVNREGNDIEAFRAHAVVRKLQKENLQKINLIEVISKNFGYAMYQKLRKDYITAKIHIAKRQIIKAKLLFVQNSKEINKALELIVQDYKQATYYMLDECIERINELEFQNRMNPTIEQNKKLITMRKRLQVANQQYDGAYASYLDLKFLPSITLFRSAKSYAINILKDMVEPEEKKQIEKKFKVHIVDNRNEIYSEG